MSKHKNREQARHMVSIKDLKLFFSNFFSKITLIGLTTGLFLGLSVVFFRAATLSLEDFS